MSAIVNGGLEPDNDFASAISCQFVNSLWACALDFSTLSGVWVLEDVLP